MRFVFQHIAKVVAQLFEKMRRRVVIVVDIYSIGKGEERDVNIGRDVGPVEDQVGPEKEDILRL